MAQQKQSREVKGGAVAGRLLQQIKNGPLRWFRAWPNKDVPTRACGAYTVWHEDGRLIYVGMSGRSAQGSTMSTTPWGLFTRLASHASGRRSGDQFCVYVCDRLVLPTLAQDQISAIGEGRLQLDTLIRRYIHEHLGYRYAVCDSAEEAYRIERAVQFGALDTTPLLNPLSRLRQPAGQAVDHA